MLSGGGNFEWKIWRNDFTNRLETMKKSQEKNEMQTCPVMLTGEKITRGIVSAKVIAFGTGEEMRLWTG